MIITDTLNGHTIEDVRRELDGSVTFYTDSGRTLTLFVNEGTIVAKPSKLILSDVAEIEVPLSSRMHLLTAFQGFMVNYAVYDDKGFITIICEPMRHDRQEYTKSSGHREICLTHKNGLINELPPVSAIINMPGQTLTGSIGGG